MRSPGKQSLWGRFWQMLITWTVYFLFRPKIIYADKTLKKRLKKLPCVYVANHTHHFDGAFGGAVLWRYKPWVLVKRSWYERKHGGWCIASCRTVPIDLDELDGEWFQISEKIIENGGSLLIFPEGGLARDKRLGEFKPGAALVAAKTGAPIVPCAIYGKYSPVFGMRQKILIGEPIESNCPENMRHSKYARQLIAKSREEVWRLYGELYKRFGDCGSYLPEETASFNKENSGEKP